MQIGMTLFQFMQQICNKNTFLHKPWQHTNLSTGNTVWWQIKTCLSLSATISYQPSHFNRTYISTSHHVPLHNDLKPFFSDLHELTYKTTFTYFLQLHMGIQKAFFIHLWTILSSFTHKKLSSYYFPLINEHHKMAVNALYPPKQKKTLLELVSPSLNDTRSYSPM